VVLYVGLDEDGKIEKMMLAAIELDLGQGHSRCRAKRRKS